ncbi:hypothetical protein K402DRAFT_402795 [Aulographum hederae CBS 113979]|uniref:Uncharacterized protein n=1 Tax=Aulographum hederae CBS 113979 TaxID=1176131 RepID=A0A6G1H6J4_9PEZI|nr:hypothetical protein K402DRAFT_402795 [Aulographum hederae CBS 113979]
MVEAETETETETGKQPEWRKCCSNHGVSKLGLSAPLWVFSSTRRAFRELLLGLANTPSMDVLTRDLDFSQEDASPSFQWSRIPCDNEFHWSASPGNIFRLGCTDPSDCVSAEGEQGFMLFSLHTCTMIVNVVAHCSEAPIERSVSLALFLFFPSSVPVQRLGRCNVKTFAFGSFGDVEMRRCSDGRRCWGSLETVYRDTGLRNVKVSPDGVRSVRSVGLIWTLRRLNAAPASNGDKLLGRRSAHSRSPESKSQDSGLA